MIYTLRLVVLLGGGRVFKSKAYDGIDEAGLLDYENRIKWATMNTMEPLVVEDENGNKINIPTHRIDATLVEKIEVREETPLSSFADEAVAAGIGKGVVKMPQKPRPAPPVQPDLKVAEEVEFGTGEAPVSPATFRHGVSSLRVAFRPPNPKVRERTPDGDVTQEMALPQPSMGASFRPEPGTDPEPRGRENRAEPVPAG